MSTDLFEYDEKPNEIVMITWKYGLYEFKAYDSKESAEIDIENCFTCNYYIIHCSDEDLTKKYLEPKK